MIMEDIKKQIEELLRRKVKNCKNSTAIFDTKDYVLLDDVLDDVSKILSQYVSDTTFADAYRAIVYYHRWRKVSEELPDIGFKVLTRNLFDVVHLGYIDVAGDWRYCLNNELIKDDIIVWKPIN